jgi:hypothetical protein
MKEKMRTHAWLHLASFSWHHNYSKIKRQKVFLGEANIEEKKNM